MPVTPVQLKTILECYYSQFPKDNIKYLPPSGKDAINWGLSHELLEEKLDRTSYYITTTSKGDFWVEQILKTPLPKIKYYIP